MTHKVSTPKSAQARTGQYPTKNISLALQELTGDYPVNYSLLNPVNWPKAPILLAALFSLAACSPAPVEEVSAVVTTDVTPTRALSG